MTLHSDNPLHSDPDVAEAIPVETAFPGSIDSHAAPRGRFPADLYDASGDLLGQATVVGHYFHGDELRYTLLDGHKAKKRSHGLGVHLLTDTEIADEDGE
jgi:hypothetical protein